MEPTLSAFLAHHKPRAESDIQWHELRLHTAAYFTEALPPLDWITSARAIVTQGQSILVVCDPVRCHVMPGGRREPNESLHETVVREVLEETGWQVGNFHLLGFLHLCHLTPKPDHYRFPYPDFFQVLYWARADSHHPQRQESGGYETGMQWMSPAAARQIDMPAVELAFLNAVIELNSHIQ